VTGVWQRGGVTTHVCAAAVFAVLVSGTRLGAQALVDSPVDRLSRTSVSGATTRQEVEPEAEHRNEVAAVFAGTWDSEEERTFFTLGVEYERRIGAGVGLGAEVEHLFEAGRWIVAAPLSIHFPRGFKIYTGPGVERSEEEEEGGDEAEGAEAGGSDEGAESHLLWRTGIGQTFEIAERWSVTPTLALDVIRESGAWVHGIVFGLSVGVGF
jgi:hypothetical protein